MGPFVKLFLVFCFFSRQFSLYLLICCSNVVSFFFGLLTIWEFGFPLEFCFLSCLGFGKLLSHYAFLVRFNGEEGSSDRCFGLMHYTQHNYTLMACLLCASLSI